MEHLTASTPELTQQSAPIVIDGARMTHAGEIDTTLLYDKSAGRVVLARMREEAEAIAGQPLNFSFSSYQVEGMSDDERIIDYQATAGKVMEQDIRAAGRSIEFGGPTERGVGTHLLPDFEPDAATNVTAAPMGRMPKSRIHAEADAAAMPLADETVGSIHISALGRGESENGTADDHITQGAITEAARVLRHGGYLVWDHGIVHDHEWAIANGLVPVQLSFSLHMAQKSDGTFSHPGINMSGVYQKP
jgi:hypothetical protein